VRDNLDLVLFYRTTGNYRTCGDSLDECDWLQPKGILTFILIYCSMGESFVECGTDSITAQHDSGEHASARAWLRGGLALLLLTLITLTLTVEHMPQWMQLALHEEHGLKLSLSRRHGNEYWVTGDDSEISDNENGGHSPSTKLRMQMLQWQLPFFGNVQTKIVKSLLQTEMAPVNAFMPPMIPLLPPQPPTIGPSPNPLFPIWLLYAPIILSASASPVLRGPVGLCAATRQTSNKWYRIAQSR
jgi:hypothetical protein